MTKIKKVNELEVPEGLDKDKLYPGKDCYPTERVRNLLGPFFTYFHLMEEMEDIDDPRLKKIMDETGRLCIETLPYLKFWLDKLG